MARVDLANLQGIVPALYRLPLSRHLLFRIVEPIAARVWLRALTTMITTGAQDLADKAEPLTNVSFTWSGLRALGVGDSATVPDLDRLFMTAPPPVTPGTWNGKFASREVHVVLHVYCRTENCLAEQTERIRKLAAGALTELDPGIGGEGGITCRLSRGGCPA